MSSEFDFTINADASLCNAIRRTIINGISSIVIHTICIIENDSQICDEMISHRLGLIPLKKTTLEPITEFKIKLEEIGPKRIYSKDIIFSPGIEPVSPDIIILDLNADEYIKLIGTTEEGTYLEQGHVKFSVSGGTSYKKLSDNLFQMHVETLGNISAKDALIRAIQIIKEDLIRYKKLL